MFHTQCLLPELHLHSIYTPKGLSSLSTREGVQTPTLRSCRILHRVTRRGASSSRASLRNYLWTSLKICAASCHPTWTIASTESLGKYWTSLHCIRSRKSSAHDATMSKCPTRHIRHRHWPSLPIDRPAEVWSSPLSIQNTAIESRSQASMGGAIRSNRRDINSSWPLLSPLARAGLLQSFGGTRGRGGGDTGRRW